MQQCETLQGVVQAQLGAAEAREAALGREQEIMQGALTGQVAGVMDMMKGLRVSLSTKLSESQSVCQALAQELAAQKAKNAAFERCCSCALLSVQLLQNTENSFPQYAGLCQVQTTLLGSTTERSVPTATSRAIKCGSACYLKEVIWLH